MLEKLVISKKSGQDSRNLFGILVTTGFSVTSFLSIALVYSLFSQALAMGTGDLNLSTLISPPSIQKKPLPEKETVRSSRTVTNSVPTRQTNMARVTEAKYVPEKVSTVANPTAARPKGLFKTGLLDSGSGAGGSVRGSGCYSNCSEVVGDGTGISSKTSKEKKKIKPLKDAPPALKKKDVVRSLGVINGRAKRLVTPRYTTLMKSLGLRGKVTVRVLISKKGRVISAKASGSHPLLRKAALDAARRTTFSPTILSLVPVRVRGVIVYNFQN